VIKDVEISARSWAQEITVAVVRKAADLKI
jgi:hypothetical protein